MKRAFYRATMVGFVSPPRDNMSSWLFWYMPLKLGPKETTPGSTPWAQERPHWIK